VDVQYEFSLAVPQLPHVSFRGRGYEFRGARDFSGERTSERNLNAEVFVFPLVTVEIRIQKDLASESNVGTLGVSHNPSPLPFRNPRDLG